MLKLRPRFLSAQLIYGLLATFLISVISCVSRIIEKGSNGNFVFNYGSLSDDGKLYLYTQMLFNETPINKIIEIYNVIYPGYEIENIKSSSKTGFSRPLYPFLTSILGDPTYVKIMFIPVVSFVIINLILFYILFNRLQILPTLLIIFCFSNSYFVKYNLLTNTTDALAALLFLMFICCLIWNHNNFIFTLGIASAILAILARPIDLALFLPSLGYLIWSKKKVEKIFSTAVIIILVLHSYWLVQYLDSIPNFGISEKISETEIPVKIVQRYFSNIFFDAAYSVTKDGFIIILLLIGFFAYRKALFLHKIVYLSTFLSGSILTIVSDGSGKGMRYYIPLLFCSILLFAVNVENNMKSQIISKFLNFKS